MSWPWGLTSGRGVWWKQALAVLVTVGLAAAVMRLGLKPLSIDRSPLILRWNFVDVATRLWRSENGQVQRSSAGLVLSPKTDSTLRPALSSGSIKHPVKGLGRIRVRLNIPQPSDGRIWLDVRSPNAITSRHLLQFRTLGGGVFEEVVVPFTVEGPTDDLLFTQVILLPSMIPQTAVVASVVLEPDASFVETAVRELVSPFPGEVTALAGTSINWLPPFVLDVRSAWMVLMPIVLLAGSVARLAGGTTRVRVVIRRSAWGTLGAVWGLGFAFLVYHQAVAVVVDTERYGGLSRDDAYAAIDEIPLSQDMREVAQFVLPHTIVEFSGVGDQAPDRMWRFWRRRATYYLLPIQVRPSASITVNYFIGPHLSCAQVEPQKVLLHEASRFCLFRTPE